MLGLRDRTEVCRRSVDLSVKVLPQALHMKGFSPVWMRWCRCSAFSCVNCFPHWSQQYGRSPGNAPWESRLGMRAEQSCCASGMPSEPWLAGNGQGKHPGGTNVTLRPTSGGSGFLPAP